MSAIRRCQTSGVVIEIENTIGALCDPQCRGFGSIAEMADKERINRSYLCTLGRHALSKIRTL